MPQLDFWDKPKLAPKITKPRLQMKQNESWAATQKGAGLEMYLWSSERRKFGNSNAKNQFRGLL